MFWVQIRNKSPVFPAWEFQPHSSTGREHQGLDKKEFLNDLSELSWGDWHYCELWTWLQRVFYRHTPEGRSLDGSFNACPHMQSRWNSLSDGARILLPLRVLPLNSVGADLFVLDAYTASLISVPQNNYPSRQGNTIFSTLHTEHSQARWCSCMSHADPGQERDLTPGWPNLRPQYYSSSCHHHETIFSMWRCRSGIRTASFLLLFGQGGTKPHEKTTFKHLSFLPSNKFLNWPP